MAPIFGYWDVRGLGNPIRYLLTHVGAEHEEKLYKCGGPPNFDRSEWLNEKFNLGLDFPNLPYYIDGDVKLTQSGVIIRYLARKHGLDGKTEADRVRAELAAAQTFDYHMEYVRIVYVQAFNELKDNYSKTLPDKMKTLTNFLGDRKYVVGDYITYADFLLFEYLEGQLYFDKEVLKNFPVLEQYYNRVKDSNGVAKYFSQANSIKFPFNGAPAYFGGQYSDQLNK